MANNFVFGAVNDQDESLQSSGGNIHFGLNESATVKSIVFNPNGTNNTSTPCCACDITFDVGGAEMRRRVFDVQRVFGSNGNVLQPNDPDYANRYASAMTQNMAVITHVIKALGVTDDQIKNLFAAGPATGFADWIQKMITLLPANYQTTPVDVFLEYQWSISADQTRTFLEVPKNMKGGTFVVPHVVPQGSAWKEERVWMKNNQRITGLHYVDASGNEHPFKRSQSYMESNKANRQDETQTVNAGQSALNNIVASQNNNQLNNDLPW